MLCTLCFKLSPPQSLPFLRDHLLTEVFPAPPPHPALDILAAMQRGSVEQHPRGVRQHYVLHVPSSSHASLVFLLPANTTRISAWSFTDTPVHTVRMLGGARVDMCVEIDVHPNCVVENDINSLPRKPSSFLLVIISSTYLIRTTLCVLLTPYLICTTSQYSS